MKKLLATFLLATVAFTLKAQSLKPVKIDSLVTVALPSEFQKRDTLGQTIYSGNSSFGYILVIKAPNPPGKILKKEKDLNKVFKEYISKLQKSVVNQQSTILNDHDTIINNVEVRDFILSTSSDEQGTQMRKFRILYTKPVTYSFQYVYSDASKDVAQKEMAQFFTSIKTTPPFDGSDQFTMYGKFQGMNICVKIGIIAGVVILLLIVIILIRNRGRKGTPGR